MLRATLFSLVLLATVALSPTASLATVTCNDQVPTLTVGSSATSTSGDFNHLYPGWEAFDAVINANSMWISQTWQTPAWIAYDFGSNRLISRYSINNSNGTLTSRAPKDFQLQGWNGSSWVAVDTRTNETGWISSQARTYTVQHPGSYTKYRLHITDDNDSRNGIVVISIGDLRFESCSCIGETQDQVPTLTGNTWRVSTSGTFSSYYAAWKAFNGKFGGSSTWISESWQTPAWIAYDFGSDRLITQYRLLNRSGPVLTSRAPKDFKLQGWNGSSWTTVDTRTNQTGWVSGTPRTYTVAEPGLFKKYQLLITDDNDIQPGIVAIALNDIEFLGCATIP